MNRAFQQTVLDYYDANGREMPWRTDPSFYHVLVSELMLQQTQVARVMTKFAEFMTRFPTTETLAAASLSDVLQVWQGLGYNRRAKYLHDAAKKVVQEGVPQNIEQLVALPGVGLNTAGAIMNYVYNIATPFIETNIRTVYLHHFFPGNLPVADREIMEQVIRTLPDDTFDVEPRIWFWALMDYGTYLKSEGSAHLHASAHYRKQSPLKGSVREVRGQIVATLTSGPRSLDELRRAIHADDRFDAALQGLQRDGLIEHTKQHYYLTK